MTRTAAELTHDLETTRDETLGFFMLGAEELSCTYGPGKWSIRFLLHHLADAETVLYERIRRVIAEPPQTLLVFDPDAWARELDYTRMPLDISRDIFASVRHGVIHLAGHHYESRGHLTFVHSTMGVRTLREEFDKVATHNVRHLGQIRAALAGEDVRVSDDG
jgi:DinB family protein